MIGMLAASIVGWQLLNDMESHVYNFHLILGWDKTAKIFKCIFLILPIKKGLSLGTFTNVKTPYGKTPDKSMN